MAPPTKPRKTTAPTSASPSPPKSYTIDRLDQVRLLAHPLRLRLFEAFALEPRTTHQVARLLGLAPTRLYHHVNALERVGLLQLKETRQVRGATEKYYQAAGRMLEFEPGLFARGPRDAGLAGAAGGTGEELEVLAGQVLEGARLDLAEALARRKETPKPLRPIIARMIVYGSPAEIAALRRHFAKWLEKYTKQEGGGRKRRGAAQGASRASFTLVFTAGPRPDRSESG
jgi:DNA-binding transcriptional ArsR family regulator